MKLHDRSPSDLSISTRQTWPFKEMEVGQVLEIEEHEIDLHKKARVAAHAYSSSNEKKFSTKTGANGSLYIQRIK